MMLYAEILLAHGYARKGLLTYEIPEDLGIQKGDGVLIPFQNQVRAGLVLNVHEKTPEFKIKKILEKHPNSPFLSQWQLAFVDWLSEYYFCSKYDVVRMLLPQNIFRIPKKKRDTKNKDFIQEKDNLHDLTEMQGQILNSFLEQKKQIGLIQGITGSGKTEIYKHLIKKNTQKGLASILLVPEISLTPQFVQYFKNSFKRLGLWHSQISEGEKAKLWIAIKNKEIDLLIGSRSALFTPFQNLGSIILDEEHEWSYKQDQNPRYHARTVAEKIAELTGAKVLLGSATPSLESRWKAEQKIYSFYRLEERIGGTPLPLVTVADMREELKKGNYSILSETLEQKIRSTLEAKEQVVLFLNRRGSGSATICRDCGYSAKCPDCEFPLTFHARQFGAPKLLCHHCGIFTPIPTFCPICKSVRIKHVGTGTEKVEQELQTLFPQAKIARADRDALSKKGQVEELHAALQGDSIDILLGTQMIAKGWDLPRVTLVGVLLADIGLNIPDFRSSERIFQLLTQVSGRAGRRQKQGQVVIQTYNPHHPTLECAAAQNPDLFYEQEIRSREDANLPPFSRLIKITFVNTKNDHCSAKASALKAHAQNLSVPASAAPSFFRPGKAQYAWNVLLTTQNPHEVLAKIPPSLLEDARIDIDPMVCI